VAKNTELLAKVDAAKESRALEKQEREAKFLENVHLDWKKMTEGTRMAALATLIRATPYAFTREGEPLYYNNLQAIMLAQNCFELGLNPFRNHVYINPKNNKLSFYVEGQQELARQRGLRIGPARYTELTRPFPPENIKNKARIEAIKSLGYEADIGVKCEIEVMGFKHDAESVVWASEWLVPKNPVWLDRLSHMLRTRAKGRALAEITGADISEDIESNEKFSTETVPVPQITTSPVEFVPAEVVEDSDKEE